MEKLTLNDKYLSAKLMATVLPIIAGEKGKDLINFYGYFRWVDDYVDEGKESGETKKSFIDRQMLIARGEKVTGLSPEEENFCQNLCKNRKHGEVVRKQAEIMLSTIRDDVDRKHVPRNEREVRHYNYRVMLSALRASTLLINEKEMKETPRFVKFVDWWMRSAGCIDVDSDFEHGLIHFPYSSEEVEELSGMEHERRIENLKVSIKNRHEKQKDYALTNLPRLSLAVFDLDIPLWQKAFTVMACRTRSCMKLKKSNCNIG